ncbi:MAG: Clp1/GlmU family protein [Candidatus Methanomethylicaceae archaeon]
MSLIRCNRGRSYLANGPTRIHLHEGCLLVLGKKINVGEDVIIPKGRSVPIEAESDSTFEFWIGSGASLEEFNGAIPADWKRAAETILNKKPPVKAIALGDVDSGKTTFTSYLSNIAYDRGFKVAVIDADPGQGEISPPTTVGLGFLRSGIVSLHNIPLKSAFFIGSTSPSELPLRVIVGARFLMDGAIAEGADLVFVNTCGWISGRRAREFKFSLIQSLEPDFVVAIQRNSELEDLIRVLEKISKYSILRVTTSPASRTRSREERKARREDAFQRYFAKSKERTFDLQNTPIVNAHYTYGKPLPSGLLQELQRELSMKLFYGELGDDFLFLVTDREADLDTWNKIKEITRINEVMIVPRGFERGIILGMTGPNGDFVGLGIISHIDYESRKMIVLTPVECDVVAFVVGLVKLDDSWHELAKLTHIPF